MRRKEGIDDMRNYLICKDIPIKTNILDIPANEMEVGESIFIPHRQCSTEEATYYFEYVLRNNILKSLEQIAEIWPDMKFTFFEECSDLANTGFRVWRIK